MTDASMVKETHVAEAAVQKVTELQAQVGAQQRELESLRVTLDGLERERDYYFRKLRDVEILCTGLEGKGYPEITGDKVVKDVQAILYAENGEDDDATPQTQTTMAETTMAQSALMETSVLNVSQAC